MLSALTGFVVVQAVSVQAHILQFSTMSEGELHLATEACYTQELDEEGLFCTALSLYLTNQN